MKHVIHKTHVIVRICLPCLFTIALGLVTASSLRAQDPEDKRQLEHEDYAIWNTIRGQNISNDGKWISYSVVPGDGDATLKIREVASDREYSVLRGSGARFSFDSGFVVYTIEPDPELIKQLRKEKKPDTELPKPKLEILNLETGKHVTIPRVRGFSMPAEAAGWVAFRLIEDAEEETVKESKSELTETYEITPEGVRRQQEPKIKPKAEVEEPATGEEEEQEKEEEEAGEETPEEGKKKEKKEEKEKDNGTTLVLRNLNTHVEQRFPHVINFRFSEDGASLAFATSAEDGEDDGVHIVDLEKLESRQIISGLGNYGQVVLSKDGRQLAFLSDRDDYEADKPSWTLYLWKPGQKEAKKIVDAESKGIPENWWLASTSAPLFSEDGRRLLFNTRPKPENMEDEEEDEDEDPVAKLDIWHWQDPFLQPQQLLQAERERNRSYRAVYDLAGRKVIQIATKEIPQVFIDPRNEARYVVGTAPDEYNKMRSWDVQSYSDWYLIDLKSGDARLLREMSRGNPSLSPGGKYITWWDGEQRTWFALPTAAPRSGDEELQPVDLGRGVGHPLHNELHDTPSLPGPYGTAGWLDDDEALLVYDRWDIWQVDPSGEDDPVCLTAGQGREDEIRFRYVRLDPEQRTVDPEQPLVLSARDHETKASGYYQWTAAAGDDADPELEHLISLDESVAGLRKAKESDAVMFTRSTFQRCPDIWASTLE
ncbi:MAG: TolB family protein, partial [Pirellulaceae bacterium]